jgi:uncharacterized membrane protein YqhA
MIMVKYQQSFIEGLEVTNLVDINFSWKTRAEDLKSKMSGACAKVLIIIFAKDVLESKD